MKEFVAEKTTDVELAGSVEAGTDWIRANMLPGAESIVRELGDEERNLPCFVRHEDAGGLCKQKAVVRVYGLLFCERHGAEVRAGALNEFYDDARVFLSRLDNPGVDDPNAAALAVVRAAVERFIHAEEDDEAAVRQAYPVIPERVDPETLGFDYEVIDGRTGPVDWNSADRHTIHRLMRQAYEDRAMYLVEILEMEREHVTAQLAFALADYDERVDAPRV